MGEISIVVPTYNEKDNMDILLGRIHEHMERFDYEVIIVDDNSPDGTSKVAEGLSERYPVKTIVRKDEKGLATAVVEGFKHASGDTLVVMDADLQHPPEKIVPLIEEIDNGADIAIGSRYAGENGFGEFGFSRKMVSKGANAIAKILFQKLSKVKDIQSGFFALRRNVVSGVDLKPTGYKILLEILIRGKYREVKETPYTFSKREKGKSKLGTGIILDYLLHLLNLFWRGEESKRAAKFVFAGLAGIAFSVGLLWFLTEKAGIFYLTSGVVSKEFTILFAFVLNELWVFNDRIRASLAGSSKRFLQFNVNRVLSIVIVIAAMVAFTEMLKFHYIISNLLGIAIAFPFNYVISNSWIWKGKGVN